MQTKSRRSLVLLPCQALLDDCKPSLSLCDPIQLDIRKLVELYVYEWGQFVDRMGFYSHLDDQMISPDIVTDTVYSYYMYDTVLPPFHSHAGRNTQEIAYDIIRGLGDRIYKEILVLQPWMPPGHISSIVGWCGNNLVIRIVK